MYQDGIGAYRRADVFTADPKRLIIMCYEKAISSLQMGRDHYLSGDFESKAKNLQYFHDIVCELRNALDFQRGGSIASNLSALYDYMSRAILEADIKRDMNTFDTVISMLEELKSAWEEIFYGSKPSFAPAPLPSKENEYRHASAAPRWVG
ncbi:MAG: flagellar export chaperone FliS [Deltaproteobacteria bacterium]|nr:flagellar export chaperone FliS [Deltaproteobacteria bacterium]